MNRKANGMVIGFVIIFFILIAGIYIKTKVSSSKVVPTPVVNKSDIDRSGAADEGDRVLIQRQFNCLKTQPCWNTTIGKTKDGDNPLYVFDLDLNQDGFISQEDVDLVK